MHSKPSSARARRTLAAVAALAAVAGMVVADPAGAIPKPKPQHRVTQAQVNAAQAAKQALAAKVGELSGQIAAAQVKLGQLQQATQLAEQKYTLAVTKEQQANTAATQAKKAVHAASTRVEQAHAKFVAYARATYMSGSLNGTAGTLLTATDPSALLEESALEQYQQQHQADAIGGLQAATVAKANADAAAQRAVLAAKHAKAVAEQERNAAQAAYLSEQQQKAALDQTMASQQRQLDAARSQLVLTTEGRQNWLNYLSKKRAYDRWKAEQKRLAEERARQARERARQQNGGGNASGWHSGTGAPSGGNWSAGKGRQAVSRAYSQLGMPYIWAGGNAYGPTDGGCTDPVAPCGTVGYDCSGLVMYAWGASWWAHYAATQYWQAGSIHPSPGNFLPGDLLFWSDNGTVGGIGHVAIYMGGGNVIQAPQSGDVVKVTPWYMVESGYFGATRPLT